MPSYEHQVRKVLSANGCTFIRHGKGDHDVWYSPASKHNFPVDGKIKSRHIANAIMRQAGIQYKF